MSDFRVGQVVKTPSGNKVVVLSERSLMLTKEYTSELAPCVLVAAAREGTVSWVLCEGLRPYDGP